ncbi:Na,H/K antiporter P-type ATPase, alpha subunit [Allomyces macrogynus ATCC 38327]|uniref:Na,H/K antiporter P-type ATPase, alpha subunit n=1 Tax=Allomyces macrogynus (strain ATCC 38327) TaxID=578462 RepID=A0A0L0SBP8_ALLM3|nr:Na,H/K antiporter P-type ATPase, alpha subunit [Allomyces macrogynus ATCC 38327]|eukprot:KNE59953.1 Na,H/K antiporter P-type ATPase, alpha subunit [Allomyces macrogynus ATCC 38327]
MAPKQENPAASLEIDEHTLDVAEISARYDVQIDVARPSASAGLPPNVAATRLAADGPNALKPPKQVHPIMVFLHCLFNPFSVLLLGACVLTFIMYGIDPVENSDNIYIGPILLGVAHLNAFIEWYQFHKSAAIMRSFMNMIPSKCTAVRQGALIEMPAAELVRGDIVMIRSGDKVPADLWLFAASDLKVDNSSLTGESEPQDRTPKNTQKAALEATNLAFNGTLVVAGDGYGVVIRTGDNTVIGQIASMTQGESKRQSPLTSEINRFVTLIGSLAVTTAIVFFIVAVTQGRGVGVALNFAVGVLVSWVPQGLPATVTMLLSFSAKRMADQNVLVKELSGVETLGTITLLATDKTGTLTRNQMTVANMWTEQQMFAALGDTNNLAMGEAPIDYSRPGIRTMLHVSGLCTRARFDRTDVGLAERQILGDATETGLFRQAAQALGTTVLDALPNEFAKVLELPFSSDTKWHLSIHRMPHARGHWTVLMKGAPERVLRVCSSIMGPQGTAVPLTDAHKDGFTQAYEYMAGKGHRVLAFAQLQLPSAEYPENYEFSKESRNFPTTGLEFVGLASLEDPPKHGVREAIGHCRRAGIKVVMVTGDHPLTAEAIGRKINLMLSKESCKPYLVSDKPAGHHSTSKHEHQRLVIDEEASAIVIHGEQIEYLTPEDWDTIFVKDEIIFARTSPKHKLEIVKHAQSLGHIVGVTGDGVNDSPALKKADLGIAMNMSGSDVSKEAAAMILLDDNFASIINGIREGRLIFQNLKKSIQYVTTHSIPEVIPQLLYVLVPLPLAISVLQIIVIDLGFELLAALSFAFEPPESEALMTLQPRRPVDEESAALRRERHAFEVALRQTATVDAESGALLDSHDMEALVAQPLTWGQRFGMWRSREYWSKWAMRGEHGEVLVDADLMSWAYLEGGLIEWIGATITFFVVLYTFEDPWTGEKFKITPTDSYHCAKEGAFKAGGNISCTLGDGSTMSPKQLEEALRQGQSIYYLSIMVMQMVNLFARKCRLTLPFSSYLFKNTRTYWSALAGIAFSVLIVYCPGIQTAFMTSGHTNPLYLLIAFGFGIILFLYSAARFAIKQKFRPMLYTPVPVGLRMHPTKWSRHSHA